MTMVFEQQPRESDKAFAAFRAYLDMGIRRSYARVVKETRVNRKSVLAWSRKFDWHGRIAAHGAHLATVERETAEAVVRANGVDWAARYVELREDEWRARKELVELAWEAIQRWRESPRRK